MSLAHRNLAARRLPGLEPAGPARPRWRSHVPITCGLLAALLPAAAAGAGTIHLTLVTSSQVGDGGAMVRLELRNGGDEAARSLAPALHFRGETTRAEVVPVLAPGEAAAVTFTLPSLALPVGRWPYRITVAYADTSHDPLHAVSVGTAVVGRPPPPSVAIADVGETRLATLASLPIAVRNLAEQPRRIRLEVHLPEAIGLIRPLPELELDGGEERRLEAELVNRVGRVGTRYAFFVSAEYDDGGVHQSVVVPGTLEIAADRPMLVRHGRLLWAAAGLLVLLWLGILVWQRVARSA